MQLRVTLTVLPFLGELDQPGEHGGYTRYLLLAVHVGYVGRVAFVVKRHALAHESEQRQQIVGEGVVLQFLAKRLDEPGAAGCVAPGIVT